MIWSTLSVVLTDNHRCYSATLKSNLHDIKTDDDQVPKKTPPPTPAFKKKHKGCSFCILDLENTGIPEIPPNQEVVGVITMGDVIEELLQEEILDETDEYVNIHNRIKVNMNSSQDFSAEQNSTTQLLQQTLLFKHYLLILLNSYLKYSNMLNV